MVKSRAFLANVNNGSAALVQRREVLLLMACSVLLDEAHRRVFRGPLERSLQVDAIQ